MLNTDASCNSVSTREALIGICHESGIFQSDCIEEVYYDNLIETGIVDSMGVVCLLDQIETHYRVDISIDQVVAELHTLDRLATYLEGHTLNQTAQSTS